MKRLNRFHLRAYRRVPVQCDMYFSNETVYGTGTVWNLSRGGWRVDSSTPVERGTTLTLFLLLPDTKQAVLIDQTEVCWSRGHEFGLKLLSIKPEDDARLTQFVTTLV